MENEKCKCIEELTTLEEVKIIEHGTDDYAELNNKPQINGHELKAGDNTLDELGIQAKGDYVNTNEITDFIKKDVTDLENYYDKTNIDSKIEDFITKAVDDLTNYYKKSETYTQEEVNQRISQIKTGGFKSVDQLPESGEEQFIYLVPAKKSFANNIKDEYIWLTDEQTFEQIGSTQLDLEGYVTDESLTQKLQEYVTTTSLEEKLQEYAKTSQIPDTSDFITDAEVDAKLLNKADKSEIPSLENYYTKDETYSSSEVDEKIKEASGTDLSAYLKKEEASETYLDKTTASQTYATKGEIPDTKEFITETTADGKYASKDEIADFITETTVDTKLEDYYTKQDIDGKGYLTEHQDLTAYMKTADADLKYATKQEIPSLDGYAKTEDIAKEYATKTEISDFVTDSQVDTKLENYLDKTTADSTYAKTTDIQDFITEANVDTKLQDYVTNQALEEKHYLTEHQDISKLATKEEVNLKADKTDLENYYDNTTIDGKLELKADKTYVDTNFAKNSDIANFIDKDVSDLTNYYNKGEVDSKLTTVYKYKGSVDTYDNLNEKEDTAEQGDVWNVNDTDKNYAWTGSAWDNLGGTIDLTPYAQKKDLVYSFINDDNKNVWELEDGNYVVNVDGNMNIQTGSSVPVGKGTIVTVNTGEDTKKHYFIINSKGSVYYGIVDEEGTAEENGNYLVELSKVLEIDNDIEYEVTSDYNPAHKKYVDDTTDSKIETATQDSFQGLERQLDGENKAKTTVKARNRAGGTELIVEIDDLDKTSEIATNSVLGAVKGKDIDDRLKVVESAGYITKEVSDLTNYYDQTTIDSKLDTKQPTGNYALKTDIPTTTSKLTNDSGFITNEVDNLANYDTSTTVDGKINNALTPYAKTSELPTVGTLDTTSTDSLAESSTESLSGKVKLHKIAKSGSYADLNNKPTPITSMSQLSNDFLMPSTENTEEGALSQSTSMPNKFFYWTESE